MICEPIVFEIDEESDFHLPASLPLKTVVDIHNLIGMFIRTERGTLVIELDGRRVVYDRIGYTPDSKWVCRLRVDPETPDYVPLPVP